MNALRVFALAIAPLSASLMAGIALGPAMAQARHDANAPLDVAADHIELQDKTNRAILSGKVVVRQAELTLASSRMTVAYTGQVVDGNPQVSRLDASGGVSIKRPDQSATSNFAVYDLNNRTILLIGDVVLNQGSNVSRGDRITLDLDAKKARLDANPGGRVTGRFSVPKRDK